MKLYTTPDQTAQLIKLGFEKPSSIASVEPIYGMGGISVAKAYTIGELIEMLPEHIFPDNVCFDLQMLANQNLWVVKYTALFYGEFYRFCSNELIDALYDMIVKLKEEGIV